MANAPTARRPWPNRRRRRRRRRWPSSSTATRTTTRSQWRAASATTAPYWPAIRPNRCPSSFIHLFIHSFIHSFIPFGFRLLFTDQWIELVSFSLVVPDIIESLIPSLFHHQLSFIHSIGFSIEKEWIEKVSFFLPPSCSERSLSID